MTKQEFVARVASTSGLSRRDAVKAVDAILDSIADALRRGDSVTFTGFGKFSTSRRAARMGVNPRNPSQMVVIPAATVPKFSAGSALKLAVSGFGPLPGEPGPIPMRKYSCPGGDFDWYQHSPSQPVPRCPTHDLRLNPAD